jgi:hypothetical protein
MIPSFSCGSLNYISLLDFSYLSLNVYHDSNDDKLLGRRPIQYFSFEAIKNNIKTFSDGWYQLAFPELHRPKNKGFYAELYAKIIDHKIIATMVAIRGTNNFSDIKEDVDAWTTSVVDSNDAALNDPSYLGECVVFYTLCKDIFHQLQSADLLSDNFEHCYTGHSLGGALANLHVAKVFSLYPRIPHVITFNPPGIGSIKGIDKTPAIEAHVVTMRAHYDFVSAIGVPYGYVINNHIKESAADAKHAFRLEASLNKKPEISSGFLGSVLAAANHYVDDFDDRPVQAYDMKEALLDQHSMSHFLKAICSSDKALLHYRNAGAWARTHSGWNHDERGSNWIV